MKKTYLRLAIIGLFTASLLFSFSSGPAGHVQIFNKANAYTLKFGLYAIACPDQSGNYSYICGPGSNDFCSNINCP